VKRRQANGFSAEKALGSGGGFRLARAFAIFAGFFVSTEVPLGAF
jgi:hypothetical protein